MEDSEKYTSYTFQSYLFLFVHSNAFCTMKISYGGSDIFSALCLSFNMRNLFYTDAKQQLKLQFCTL
jgi:hypothetical protein